MADAATVVMKTTILPDEVAKTIEATSTISVINSHNYEDCFT